MRLGADAMHLLVKASIQAVLINGARDHFRLDSLGERELLADCAETSLQSRATDTERFSHTQRTVDMRRRVICGHAIAAACLLWDKVPA
eukprot:6801464-Prymnesium_polylepis.1